MIISFDIMNENDYKKYLLTPPLALCGDEEGRVIKLFPKIEMNETLVYIYSFNDLDIYDLILKILKGSLESIKREN